jgi:hypothetical protein
MTIAARSADKAPRKPGIVNAAELSGKPDCCWTATAPRTGYPTLEHTISADVAVVGGGGIVGTTAAYRAVAAQKIAAQLASLSDARE